MAARKIVVAHSPDSDDAFMFYGLASGKVAEPGLEFVHELHDIETLNLRADEGIYDLTAVSFHAWPYVRDHYRLMTAGASVGDGYGPVLVARRTISRRDLDEVRIAVAGTMTTSYLALKLYCPHARTVTLPFEKIMESVERGDVDAGVLIHEGQLTFARQRLARIADLGEWWSRETGLPLPLGANALRRSLDAETTAACCRAMKATVEYALAHRDEALDHAMKYARGLDRSLADRFVGMYVNSFTVDIGDRGREAVRLLYRLAHEAGLLKAYVEPEFIEV